MSDGSNTYTWNSRNELTGISGAMSAAYQYDAMGRRKNKTLTTNASPNSVAYLYDGDNFVQEQAGSNGTRNLITGGIDELFSRSVTTTANNISSTTTSSVITDALGSTLALTDASGTAQTRYTYEAYGKTSTTGTASDNASQYTGREADSNNLYYYRARYYLADCGRFISEDPIGWSSGQTNNYAYVGGNPVSFTDPSGLLRWCGSEPKPDWWDEPGLETVCPECYLLGVGYAIRGAFGQKLMADGVNKMYTPFNVPNIVRIERHMIGSAKKGNRAEKWHSHIFGSKTHSPVSAAAGPIGVAAAGAAAIGSGGGGGSDDSGCK